MPVITVEAAVLTHEQKAELAKALTESAARIMGNPAESIYVFIRENAFENIGVGGKLLADAFKEKAEAEAKEKAKAE